MGASSVATNLDIALDMDSDSSHMTRRELFRNKAASEAVSSVPSELILQGASNEQARVITTAIELHIAKPPHFRELAVLRLTEAGFSSNEAKNVIKSIQQGITAHESHGS